MNFSQSGFHLSFEVTDKSSVILKSISKNECPHLQKKGDGCSIVEIHVCGQNPNGHHFAKHTDTSGGASLRYQSHRYYENEYGNKLEFLLSDSMMQVIVHYQFYTNVACLRCWTTVTNISDTPFGLEYVSSFCYTGIDEGVLPVDDKLKILIPHNASYKEVNWRTYTPAELGYERYDSSSGKRIAISNTGTWSSKEHLPMGAICNTESKNTMLWQIESNGSWHWEISDIRNMLYVKLSGPTEQENQWYRELLPSESFESVKVALALGEDFNQALEQLTHYRRILASKRGCDAALPVIFNDYMNCLMGKPTEEKLLPIIDRAASVGAEYFCIDAGWYADGTWWDSVGEWLPSSWRFPNGLLYTLNHIRSKGMIPGLWTEIEVMGIHCPLASVWKDECFFMRHGKRVIDHGRYQLDFRHPFVREYASSVISRLVEEYGIGYVKNDYNIEAGMGTEVDADSFGDGLLGHNRAFLKWVEEIRKKYPQLIWENCSSGGMRMDYGMLSVADLQSISDQTNYKCNAYIAAAAATGVAPEQAAIWSYPKATDSSDAVVMNMVNSLLLRVHLSGEIDRLSDEQMKLVKEAVICYKTIRCDISSSIPFYPFGIPQYNSDWICTAYRTDKVIRMVVCRMDTDQKQLDIPLDVSIQQCNILYPTTSDATVTTSENGVCIKLNRRYQAVVLEVRLQWNAQKG